MIVFRHVDSRFPFLWEGVEQPPARWHAEGEGPVQYLADTPNGAWAEFLRHEEIKDPEDLRGVRRALWAVELPDHPAEEPALSDGVLTGDRGSYSACQAEARRLRAAGVSGLQAPPAALLPGGAGGWRVAGGLQEATPRDGLVFVLFGLRPELVGWPAVREGAPPEDLLPRVRHFA